MKFITRTFGGKPLTILIGHEDFDLVFIVNQIAEVCHIATPSAVLAMTMEATSGWGFFQLREVLHEIESPELIGTWGLEHVPADTWMAASPAAYRMLLRSESPVEPFFYRWLTDDLLPETQGARGSILQPTDSHSDELTQLKTTIRSLERRLSASMARERRLERFAETLDKNLESTTRELLTLRKGLPYVGTPSDPPASLLDRVQLEADELSYDWRRSLRRDLTAIAGAQLEERLYRSRRNREDRRS